MNQYLPFKTNVATSKPNTLINKKIVCPFCNREQLKKDNRVLNETEKTLIIENKFRTIQDTYQTVYVEHDTCEFDLSNYPKDILYNVIQTGIDFWRDMEKSGEFQSVMFFKNHGLQSGGSIHHPHMQFIGLDNIDYRKDIFPEYFEGINIYEDERITWNISTKPKTEFLEFNIILRDKGNIEKFPDFIQFSTHYILNTLNPDYKSYNISFYEYDDKVIAKVINRFVTSALILGFNISQVPTDIEKVALYMKKMYLV